MKRVWKRQPPHHAGINLSHALARGLVYASDLRHGQDAISRRLNTQSGAKPATAKNHEAYGPILGVGFGATYGTGAADQITTPLTSHTTKMSFEVLVYRNGGGGSDFGRILDKGGDERWFTIGDVFNFIVDTSGNFGQWEFPDGTIGQWHLHHLTYDAGDIATDPVAYLNGIAQTVTELATPTGTVATNGNSYVIGNRAALDRNWDGVIAHVLKWDRILTAAEVKARTRDVWSIYDGQSLLAMATEASGGGTIYTRTLADSVAVADSPVRGQRHGRVTQDALTSILDSVIRGQSHGRVTTDPIALVDSIIRGQQHGRVLADGLSVVDTLRRFAILYRLTTDSFDVFDSLSATVSGLFVRVLADNISVIDLVQRSQLHGRVLGDALVIADSIIRSQLHGRVLTDSVSLIESVFRAALLYRLARDGVDTTDALVETLTRASTDIGIILMLLEQAQPVISILEPAQPIELSLGGDS